MPTRSFASRFESGSSIRNACRLADDRAAHRDALLLAAGELRRAGGRAARRGRAASRPRSTRCGDLLLRRFRHAQRVAEVLPHRHVRVERVVLEDHREVARRRARPFVTSRSPIRIRPPVIFSRPPIERSSVVLPQPDGPTRTMNSPSPIVRLDVVHREDAAGELLGDVSSTISPTARNDTATPAADAIVATSARDD